MRDPTSTWPGPRGALLPFTLFILFILFILAAAASVASPVHAQDGPPLAVTVESDDSRVRAGTLRDAVSRVLDVSVVSLLDAGVERTRGTLAVVVARGGRSAQLFFQARAGRRQLVHVTAPDGEVGASWIAVAIADFVRRSLETDRWHIQSEVLDPFDGAIATPGPRNSEVIDPWADQSRGQPRNERPDALGRPHPR
jgi:hypothetical protein